MTGEVLAFPRIGISISPDAARANAEAFLSAHPDDRSAKPEKFGLNQSETFLCLCQILEQRLETVPAEVVSGASFLYDFVECSPEGQVNFLFDEREYYLGEYAYLLGCASRVLTRRDESREWLDRAEAWFLLTSNALADVARVNYQRLALKVEERKFEDVLRLVPALTEAFRRLNARELLLKTQFVQGQVLKETSQFEAARTLFLEISAEAEAQGNERLLALALSDLSQLHAALGEADKALTFAKRASPVLKRLDNRVGLAKLNWGLANLFRAQNRLADAIRGYREAQAEFAGIKMRADVAAIQLVIADLLLESGQEAQAEWEIRAALPVIDELKMVPEGVAALSLLRESVRRRKIDRQALRDLHGYFDEIQS